MVDDYLSSELALEMAKRLKDLRLQKEWSRVELARRAGINVFTLKHFERSGQISLQRLIALCEALGISHEVERLFKPRHRVDVNTWEVSDRVQRKRGRRISEELKELNE